MKLLWVLCVLFAFGVSGLALDREAFTFTNYDLNVRVEPEQQRLGVRGKITLRNDSDVAQKSVCLQISLSLNWSSIQLGGKPAEFLSQIYTSDIDHTGALTEAIVTLPQPLAPRQSVELEIGYEGIILQDTTRLTRIGVPKDAAKHSDWDQIGRSFTAVRGIGYVAWYPIATEAASLSEGDSVFETAGRWKKRETEAQMRIAFEYLSGSSQARSEIVCNGREATKISQGAGPDQPSLDCSFAPIRWSVPIFAMANYSDMDRDTVSIHYLPDHKSSAEDYALAAGQTAPLVDKWFGDHRDKPETKAQVVELGDSSASPFESGNMLLMPLTGKDTALLLSAIQQLTHVAFPSPRGWIYQGLAAYAQVSYVQEEEGRQAAIAYLHHHREILIQTGTQIQRHDDDNSAAHSLVNSPDEFYVETKAMNAWWMLRDMVGEDALTAALHNYRAANDKDASYMQKLIEAQAHRDLEWFFDDWVYRDRGLPDFRVVYVYPRKLLNGGYMVTVTVENLGAAAAEVPVTLHLEKGEASERLIVPGKSKATVRIQAVSLPLEVSVNDGSVPESDTTNNMYKVESAPQAQ